MSYSFRWAIIPIMAVVLIAGFFIIHSSGRTLQAFEAGVVKAESASSNSFTGEITTTQLERNRGNVINANIAWVNCPAGSTKEVDLFIEAQGERPYYLQSIPGWYQAISCPTDGWSFHWNLFAPSDRPDESWGNSATLTIYIEDQKIVEKTVPIIPPVGTTQDETPPADDTPPSDDTPPRTDGRLEFVYHLNPGWNMISAPFAENAPTAADFQKECGQSARMFYRWDNQTNRYPGPSNRMIPGQGFWVHVDQSCRVAVRGDSRWAGQISFPSAGIYMIGGPNIEMGKVSHNCAIEGLWNWDASARRYQSTWEMKEGVGYFIRVGAGCSMQFFSATSPTEPSVETNHLTVKSQIAGRDHPGANISRISGPSNIGGSTEYRRTVQGPIDAVLEAPASFSEANFSHWSGCKSSDGRRCTVSVSGSTSRMVIAHYFRPADDAAPPPPGG